MASPISEAVNTLSRQSSRRSHENEEERLRSDQLEANERNDSDHASLPAKKISQAIRSSRLSGSSSPEKCSICLNIPDDRSYTDSCFHEFCFVCLVEWSKVKSECPLCKQKFKSIIHNIRSINDYDKYTIPEETETFGIDDAGRRFRFRTTMTVERAELLRLIRQLHLQLQEMQRDREIMERNRQMYVRRLDRLRRLRHLFERSAERRERLTATSDFRRVVYERRLRAIPLAPGEMTRTSRPEFYVKNPATVIRLIPWLRRELNVLFHGESGRVNFLIQLIQNLLVRYPIESDEFRRCLLPYLGTYTEAFIHEFNNFARSPYEMEEYDRRAQYESWLVARARLRGPDEAPPEIVIGSSPSPERHDDSDVEMTEPDRPLLPYRNPSPPPHPWTTDNMQRADAVGQSMLFRAQTFVQRRLRFLETCRRIDNVRSRLARMDSRSHVTNARTINSTINLLSSSSDEDDSPRLDPNARTPPYLLSSHNRSSNLAGAVAKRRLGYPAASANSTAVNGLHHGASSRMIFLDDDDEDDDYEVRLAGNNESVATFSNETPEGNSATSFAPIVSSGSSVGSDASVDRLNFGSTTPADSMTPLCIDGSPVSSAEASSGSYGGPNRPPMVYDWHQSPTLVAGGHNYARFSSSHHLTPLSSGSGSPDIQYRSYNWHSHAERSSSPLYQDNRSNSTIRDNQYEETSWNRGNLRRTLSPIDPDEVQIVNELKPKHLRTPELITLRDEAEDIVDEKPSSVELSNITNDGPTTSRSHKRERSRSREHRHQERRSHKSHRHHSKHRHQDDRHHHKRRHRHHHSSDDERSRSRHRYDESDHGERRHRHRDYHDHRHNDSDYEYLRGHRHRGNRDDERSRRYGRSYDNGKESSSSRQGRRSYTGSPTY